ncbi:MAG TPA: cytochrome c [Flavobacteriales bacterium]|jgi:mono/diheme cytochrome c family protein|nr:cytochrome c [SAR202 cluster bacterium]HJN64302.1 cytochrome c [Flavobacteriales bacterium]|tara:strand:+ start:2667 stop:3137 length:471 start_codon:yes stop_codon:yes gene_type:complete
MKNISVVLFISMTLLSCVENVKNPEVVIKGKEINPMRDKGVGPITELDISSQINEAMAEEGKIIFNNLCSVCHKLNQRLIGPELTGVTKRRTPEWIMNMIMNPEQMVKENTAAKKLLIEYASPMTNQNLTENETRSILEYLRSNDKKILDAKKKQF